MDPLPAPLILCTGVFRSGSTWSYNVCRHLAYWRAQRRGEQLTSGYVEEADLDRALGNPCSWMTGSTVLKAHGIGPLAMGALREGQARAVCTFRDPRDCVASDLTFLKRSFDDVVRRVGGYLSYLGYYRAAGHTLFVRYEAMVADPLSQVARIAAHLGIDADAAELRRIDDLTSLESSRAICAALRHRPAEGVLWSETRRVDPATQLHENHIHSGRVGRWRDELTPVQQDELTAVFHPWLVELGYEPAGGGGASAYG